MSFSVIMIVFAALTNRLAPSLCLLCLKHLCHGVSPLHVIFIQYRCGESQNWTDMPEMAFKRMRHEICSFTPGQSAKCELRALNDAGKSEVAEASIVKTPCACKF